MLHELQQRRKDEFMASFVLISNKFKDIYQLIANEKDVNLELKDSADPFSKGVYFKFVF